MSTRFSPDGAFWWDGERWQLALSVDGLWRWDGARWVATWSPPPQQAPGQQPHPTAGPAVVTAPPPTTGWASPPAQAGARPAAAAPWAPPAKAPPPPRVLSVWTRPLQWATSAWLVLAAITEVAGGAYLLSQGPSIEASVQRTSTDSALTPDDIHNLVQVAVGAGFAFTLFLAALFLFLAWGGLRRWAWVYIVDIVLATLTVLTALGAFGQLAGSSSNPRWLAALDLVVGLTGVALAVVMVVALIRYGIWASPRTAAISSSDQGSGN